MGKPRIIIADTDTNYIIPLQMKLAEMFFNEIELEIVTEEAYFQKLFVMPQKADLMIVAEELYSEQLKKHNIRHLFILVEHYEAGQTDDLTVNKIFKYTSTREILNQVVGKCKDIFDIQKEEGKHTQVILVCSAEGGAGKTTVAMGIAGCLEKNYKKTLYIDAEYLQSFGWLMEEEQTINDPGVYYRLQNPSQNIYQEIRHTVRQELFSYLPQFKAALLSLAIDTSVYRKIIDSAKRTDEYDYIVVDTDNIFDEEKTKMIEEADKVVMVMLQTQKASYAVNRLLANISGVNNEKYLFVCNNFRKGAENFLLSSDEGVKYPVSEYIEHMDNFNRIKCSDLIRSAGIQKIAFLIM